MRVFYYAGYAAGSYGRAWHGAITRKGLLAHRAVVPLKKGDSRVTLNVECADQQ